MPERTDDPDDRPSDVVSRLVGLPDAELAAVVDAATRRLRGLGLDAADRRQLSTERAIAEALLRDRARRRDGSGDPPKG